jgi:AAA+ ATPase superfamily predicted ATPase
MPSNPFHYEIAADRWSFTDREGILPRLEKLRDERGRRMLIYGRRRMGKTSLIHEAARRGRVTLIGEDLSGAGDLVTVANRLLALIPPPKDSILVRLLKKVGEIRFGDGKFSVTVRMEPKEQSKPGIEALRQALELMENYAALEDNGLTVYFDEFQEIRGLVGDRAEWMLRSVIQHHKNLNYIFCGSDHRIVRWLTEPTAAFYKQLELIKVDPIDPQLLADWIDERSKAGGLPTAAFGQEVVASVGPCTGDIIRLARTVFDLYAGRQTGNAIRAGIDAIALREWHDEFAARWHPLTSVQRGVLRALAKGLPPQSGDTIRLYHLNTAATAQTALEALEEDRLVIRDERGKPIVDNPFFRRWINAFDSTLPV